MAGETNFLAIGNQVFFIFERLLIFFNEILHSGKWKPLSFVRSFFLIVETVAEITGSEIFKRDYILTDEN